MLNENLKNARKAKGLSQEELALRLNVVRQTVSKWEKGLSVPDSEMLINISKQLDTPVHILLGEEQEGAKHEKTEKQSARKKLLHVLCGVAFVFILFCILLEVGIYIYANFNLLNSNADVGIIGGADGPTAILVSGAFNWLELAGAIILLGVAMLGFLLTKNNKK